MSFQQDYQSGLISDTPKLESVGSWVMILNRHPITREWAKYQKVAEQSWSRRLQDYDPWKCLALLRSIASDIQLVELRRVKR